jgi:hypothetical protein
VQESNEAAGGTQSSGFLGTVGRAKGITTNRQQTIPPLGRGASSQMAKREFAIDLSNVDFSQLKTDEDFRREAQRLGLAP